MEMGNGLEEELKGNCKENRAGSLGSGQANGLACLSEKKSNFKTSRYRFMWPVRPA